MAFDSDIKEPPSIYGLLAYFGVGIQAYSQVVFAIVIALLLLSTFTRLKKGLYAA